MSNKQGKDFWDSLPQKEKENILTKEGYSWNSDLSSGEKQSFWKKYISRKKKSDSKESEKKLF